MTMDGNSKRLQSALSYAAAGLHVVLLGDAGTKKGKVPRLKDWGNKTTLDEETLLDHFESFPNANLGVLLGPTGGVIDVEFDNEQGRNTAAKLFENCITPTYESVRSIHRLFKWSGEIPPVQKIEFEGLEIRLGGGNKQTQSVLPPSVHPDGTEYRWLEGLSIHEVDPVEIPDELMVRICNVEHGLEAAGLSSPAFEGGKSTDEWKAIHDGVGSGDRNNSLAALTGKYLSNMVDIDTDQRVADCFSLINAWNSQNTPPLPQREVRATFESILKRERRRRLEESMSVELPQSAEQQVSSAAGLPKPSKAEMRLTIIQGDPAIYRLHWGRFSTAGGYIDLGAGQLGNFASVRTAALEKAFIWLPDELRKKWSCRNGIVQELVLTAERVDPDDAVHRPSILAETICGLAARAGKLEPEQLRKSGVVSGTGIQVVEDLIVVHATKLHGYLKAEQVVDKLTLNELVSLLNIVNAENKKSTTARWWELNKASMARLRSKFLGGVNVSLA